MRTNTIEWLHHEFPSSASIAGCARILNRASRLATKGLTALLPALALIVASAWAINAPNLEPFLQASLWAAGFIFLALAIESEKPTVGLLLTTGIVLPVLALLSSRVAGEFAIVGAALVATWLAASILRR